MCEMLGRTGREVEGHNRGKDSDFHSGPPSFILVFMAYWKFDRFLSLTLSLSGSFEFPETPNFVFFHPSVFHEALMFLPKDEKKESNYTKKQNQKNRGDPN